MDRRYKKRDRAPPAEQKVFHHELREMLADAGLAQVPFKFVGSAKKEHPHVAMETDVCRRPRASARLASRDIHRLGNLHRWHWSLHYGHMILPKYVALV